MFRKILIANRGEIALRVIRACADMDIRSVAVHSTADTDSLHVRFADEAVCIGGPLPAKSYLNIPAIISAAEVTDAEAIHPGYGFLAENAHFAEVCESCNVAFIGPTPDAIRMMGDKIEAKQLMRKIGVPVIPGSEGSVPDEKEAVKIARSIGYPVIIKAAGGGGGRGMRIAHTDVSLSSAFLTARAEAEAAFANPEVYIEKYFGEPRHVEIQLLGDKHGQVVHLNERDCTIQRRHQKLVEESPSPVLTPAIRKEMGDAAVRIGKAVKYTNAGTIEFLVDRDGTFYFMEMNTRLQVEHGVTETVLGIDLVREQLLVAAGEHMTLPAEPLGIRGAAIECRVNAEDPLHNFAPCPGRIQALHLPGGPGVRVDTHIYDGYTVPPYYDSLLAKVVTNGRDRNEAIARMYRALGEFVIEGIKTNIPFMREVVNSETFRRGVYSTRFLEHFRLTEV
jgi:acetyl-CoA carboxylase biotin carboxylase subunit